MCCTITWVSADSLLLLLRAFSGMIPFSLRAGRLPNYCASFAKNKTLGSHMASSGGIPSAIGYIVRLKCHAACRGQSCSTRAPRLYRNIVVGCTRHLAVYRTRQESVQSCAPHSAPPRPHGCDIRNRSGEVLLRPGREDFRDHARLGSEDLIPCAAGPFPIQCCLDVAAWVADYS